MDHSHKCENVETTLEFSPVAVPVARALRRGG